MKAVVSSMLALAFVLALPGAAFADSDSNSESGGWGTADSEAFLVPILDVLSSSESTSVKDALKSL